MRVHINAGGREVTVECTDANVSTKDIVAEALDAWRATDGAVLPSAGPANGAAYIERANGWGFAR